MFWISLAFIYGILIGSFTNVLIYRIPNGLGVVHGRSFCPNCNHSLSWLELVPVVSYLCLRGKCHSCKAPISIRYPIVELLGGLAYGLCIWRFGATVTGVCWCLIATCLIALSGIDFDHLIIPDRFPAIILAVGVVLCVVDSMPLLERGIGFFSVSGILLLIAVVTGGRGMGGGDIKLMAALGLCLGYRLCLLALPVAAFLALGYAGIKTALKKGTMRGELPFGPFLSLSSLLCAFWGDGFLNWYVAQFLTF